MEEIVDESPDMYVVIASDNPQRVAALLLQLLQVTRETLALVIVGFGSGREAVVSVFESLDLGRHRFGGSLASDASDRWEAIGDGIELTRGPTSFGGPDVVVILSDDAVPPAGWEFGMRDGLFPTTFVIDEQPAMAILGQIGIVGSVSEQSSMVGQRIALSATDGEEGPDEYASTRRKMFGGMVSPLDVPDDLALLVRRSLIDQLAADGGIIRKGLGRWSYADLVLRARELGFRSVVAEASYMGRVEMRPTRPETPGEVESRIALYATQTSKPPKLFALLNIRTTSLRDLHLLRGTIARAAPLVAGFVVVLGNNPLDIQSDPEFLQAKNGGGTFTVNDAQLLTGCSDADPRGVGQAFAAWVAETIRASGITKPQHTVICDVWTGAPNDPGERAKAHDIVLAMRERMGLNAWALALGIGDLVEDGVTPEFVTRLCSTPNPTVLAYDLPVLTLWDAPRLVREDPPYGSGHPAKPGPSAVRLYRVLPGAVFPRLANGRSTAAPACSPDAIRVASIRLRNATLLRPADRARLGVDASEEGMRCSVFRPMNRIGLHMLVYERESPEDVGRWLDELHGVLDHAVLVWTSEAEVPRAMKDVAAYHGASLIQHPLADNLAGARNAGIAALAERGLSWALFFDPDEWLRHLLEDGKAIRRMAESSRKGWLFQVANYATEGSPSISDSIRMSAIEPGLVMNGRVHEGFGDAINAMQQAGVEPRLAYAPFLLQHRGMALGAERTAEKLAAYERLLRLELAENPLNPGAWVSLAWHLEHEGYPEMAAEALRRSLACAGTAYLPFREAGIAKLREARALFECCVDRLSPSHQYAKHASEILAWLRVNAPAQAHLGVPSGRVPEPLPAFDDPARYDPEQEGS